MRQEKIIRMLKEAKDKGYITGNLPDDPAELKALAQRIEAQIVYQQPNEAEKGTVVGRLDFVLRPHPSGPWDDSADRTLPIFLIGDEWSALFRDVLHVKDPEPYVAAEDIEEYTERQRMLFQQSIAEYPMLGRIWDMYTDASYEPNEMSQLRDECLRVKASTSNVVAMRGLDKLLRACDEALEESLGLILFCD